MAEATMLIPGALGLLRDWIQTHQNVNGIFALQRVHDTINEALVEGGIDPGVSPSDADVTEAVDVLDECIRAAERSGAVEKLPKRRRARATLLHLAQRVRGFEDAAIRPDGSGGFGSEHEKVLRNHCGEVEAKLRDALERIRELTEQHGERETLLLEQYVAPLEEFFTKRVTWCKRPADLSFESDPAAAAEGIIQSTLALQARLHAACQRQSAILSAALNLVERARVVTESDKRTMTKSMLLALDEATDRLERMRLVPTVEEQEGSAR